MSSSLSYTVRNNNNVVEETFSTEDVPHSCPTNGGDVSVTSGEYETPLPFETEDDFTDVTLVVEGRPLHTNRSLLAFASPVFACMFTSEFRERTERTIALPGKSLPAVGDMLAFLHPGVGFTLTRDNVFPLVQLAEEYQVHVLKAACEEFLVHTLNGQVMPMASFLLRCLETAEVNSLTSLHERCVELFADPDVPLQDLKASEGVSLATRAAIFERRIERMQQERREMEAWKSRVNTVKRRLKEIVVPHGDHCRCRVEVKLRTPVQRTCQYCTRTWCTDNISTDAYRSSYQFYCNHKIGFHIAHDATIRQFLDQVDLAATGPPPSGTVAVIRAPRGPPEDGFDGGFVGWPRS